MSEPLHFSRLTLRRDAAGHQAPAPGPSAIEVV